MCLLEMSTNYYKHSARICGALITCQVCLGPRMQLRRCQYGPDRSSLSTPSTELPFRITHRLNSFVAGSLLCSYNCYFLTYKQGFPGGSERKEFTCHRGDLGSVPGLGRSPGEGNSHPLQYSGLENSTDRGAWGVYSPWGPKELDSAYKKQ